MEWEYEMINFLSGSLDSTKLTITKDTIIDNVEFKIMISQDYNCNMRPIKDFVYSENNKIYFYHQDDSTFYLLYDFNAEIGDTIKIKNWGNYADDSEYTYWKIDSIGTVNYSTNELKTFRVQYGRENADTIKFFDYYLTVIEGIGCTTNLFYLVDTGFCDGKHVNELRCFGHPQLGYFSNNNGFCNLTTSIAENSINENEIKIYPNPTYDKIIIDDFTKFSKVEIFDIRGIKHAEFKITKEVKLSNLKSGTYIVKLTGKSNSSLFKIQKL